MQIVSVLSESEIRRVAAMAAEIWPEHYNALIGSAQVDYMLQKFQSAGPIAAQIQDGMHYKTLRSPTEDLGYLAYSFAADHCFLSKLYLRAEARGMGLGRKGLEHVCAQAIGQGLKRLQLTVSRGNQMAINCYLAWGFVKVDEVVIGIGDDYVMDDYLMQLAL